MATIIHCLLTLVFISITRCEEKEIITANEDELLISIGENQFPNPCKTSKCPSGEKCTIQYVPRLLHMPIAHCVESTTALSEGMCSEYMVGTNILHCKSEAEWNDISSLQCHLRSIENTKLASTKVQHPCPDIRRTGVVKFLTASFNCCTDNIIYYTTEKNIEPADIASNTHYSNEMEPGRKNLQTIFICLGVTILFSLLLMTASIVLRCRHSKRAQSNQHPSLTPVKTIINPEVYLDYNDKTRLITKE